MMFMFGDAEADRAFAADFGLLAAIAGAAIAGAIFWALVWLSEVFERAHAARKRMRR